MYLLSYYMDCIRVNALQRARMDHAKRHATEINPNQSINQFYNG